MKKLEELSTNLSHVQTCQSDERGGFDLILKNIKNKTQVSFLLKKQIELIHANVALTVRLDLFKKLNAALRVLMEEYRHDETVFHLFFDLMSLFKTEIDVCPQEDMAQSDEEWLELEKSVYLLCEWEDEVFGQSFVSK